MQRRYAQARPLHELRERAEGWWSHEAVVDWWPATLAAPAETLEPELSAAVRVAVGANPVIAPLADGGRTGSER